MPYSETQIRMKSDRYSTNQIKERASEFNLDRLRESMQEKIDALESRLDEATYQIEKLRSNPQNNIPEDVLNTISRMTVQRSVSIPVTVDQGGTGLTDNNYFYLGGTPTTEGAWRFAILGNDLLVQRRESSVWVEKSAFLAS